MVLKLIRMTRADMAFTLLDKGLRPLPFLAQALLSTLFISVVPIFLIYAMNCLCLNSTETKENFTFLMLSFAIGGLLGDVFFHTIPHLNGGDSHDNSQGNSQSRLEEDMQTNLIIIMGIWFFFLIEKITNSFLSGQ